MKPIKI